MSVTKAIRAAIETYVKTLIPEAQIAWDNVTFQPVGGTWWGRVTLFPGTKRQRITVGASAVLNEGGFVDIGLFFPEDKGAGEADEKADQILAAFEGGVEVTSADGTIHFDTPNRTGAIQENRWYQINITAPYRLYRTV